MNQPLPTLQQAIGMIESSHKLSENTRKRHVNSLRRISALSPRSQLRSLLLQPDRTFQSLEKHVAAPTTLHTILIGVLSTLRLIKQERPAAYKRHETVLDAWYGIAAKAAAKVRESRKSMTPRQKLAHVDWQAVKSVREKLARTDPGGNEHLLVSMYSLLPPRRQMDYYRVRLSAPTGCRDELASGALDFSSTPPVLTVWSFKTVKHMDPWEKKIPSTLARVISRSINDRPRQYLFVDHENNPFDSVNSFTQFTNRILKRHLGPHCSLNALRHSYATHVHNSGTRNVSNVAYDMAHSLDMHKTYVFNEV